MNYIKANYIIIAGLVITCIILLWQPCTPKDDRDAAKEQAVITQTEQRYQAREKHIRDSVKRREDSLQLAIDVTAAALNNKTIEFNKQKATASTYIKLYNREKNKPLPDSGILIDVCDTLVTQVVDMGRQIEAMQVLQDSTNSYTKQVMDDKDKQIASLRNSLESSMRYGSETNDKYTVALGSLTKQNKKLRRAQFLNKVTPIAGFVLGVVVGSKIK